MAYNWIHIFLAQKQPSPLKMEKRSVAAQEGLVSNLIREKDKLDTQKYYGVQLYSRKKHRKKIFSYPSLQVCPLDSASTWKKKQ